MRRKTSVIRGFLSALNARKIPVCPGSTRTIWIYIVSLRYKREFVDVEDVRLYELITEPFAEKIKAALKELIAGHYGPLHGLVAVKIGKAEKECVGPLVR